MQLLESFIKHLQHIKRFSSHTVKAYHTDLLQFNNFLTQEYDNLTIVEVEPIIIRSWIVYLIEHEVQSKSINRKISSLNSFYKYLLRNNKVATNPIAKVITPKTSKKLPIFVGQKEMNSLLDDVEFEKTFSGQRDKIVLELLYNSGIRLSELINIKKRDIDFNNLTLKVLGKRNKERIIPITKEVAQNIQMYIQLSEKEFSNKNEFLILTNKGDKVYQKLVYRIVYNYLSKVSTLAKKSPHVLRHTFATHMLNNGADLNSIKELLGHANLSATQVYTHNTIEKLKNIHKQAHPRA